METFDVAIIGGGPAGLFAATHLTGCKTVLLEKMQTVGNKLLLSGSGQCNVTHNEPLSSFITHYGDNGSFIKIALKSFSSNDTIRYLKENGIRCEITDENKVFPASRNAHDIVDVLVHTATRSGCRIYLNREVIDIQKEKGKFIIKTISDTFSATYLILACGGFTYPQTGSTGDGAHFAITLGHTIVPLREALTPVYVHNFPLKDLTGISLSKVEIRIVRNKKTIVKSTGDLLITRTGVSGPVILNSSRWMKIHDIIEISFVNLKPETFNQELILQCTHNGAKQIGNLLRYFNMPERLIHTLLNCADIDATTKGSQISALQRRTLVTVCTAYQIPVDALGDVSIAMATAGGVDLTEINRKTGESKICPNLYFAGEVMDIDGDTGGYNIQAAISTAYLAASAIMNRFKTELIPDSLR